MSAGVITDALPAARIEPGDADQALLHRLAESGRGAPEAVLYPESDAEAAAVMRWASRSGVGVLPLASGSRLRPSASGDDGRRWVAMRTTRLSGIEVYEAADLTLTAGAGTPLAELDAALRSHRQWAPFDPPHVLDRTLGGLVADGSSGPLWAGYGQLRNHVLGMTVVTGDGRILRLGGRVVKNVAGFDLLKPMTGSRGVLALMAAVTLRVFPVPVEDLLLVARGASVEALLPHALRAGTAPVLPVSCVLADVDGPLLVIRLHGAPATVAADRATIESHVGRALEAHSAAGDDASPGAARDLLRRVRDGATDGPFVLEASARPSRLPELLRATGALRSSALVVDSYAGNVRLSGDFPGERTLAGVVEKIRTLGGASRVVAAPPEANGTGGGGAPDGPERALVEGLRGAFDPEGVLWPAR